MERYCKQRTHSAQPPTNMQRGITSRMQRLVTVCTVLVTLHLWPRLKAKAQIDHTETMAHCVGTGQQSLTCTLPSCWGHPLGLCPHQLRLHQASTRSPASTKLHPLAQHGQLLTSTMRCHASATLAPGYANLSTSVPCRLYILCVLHSPQATPAHLHKLCLSRCCNHNVCLAHYLLHVLCG